MTTFKINFDKETSTLKIGFNPEKPATNVELVKDAEAEINAVKDKIMGPLLKITGPASLPVAFVLAHTLSHLCGAIAIFDPKLGKFVVAVSHNPDFKLGDSI
tara:strand:+ start:3383 stop:3688 length:306 start_codon:yes stop_codon:yes gene_type:complete